MGGRPALGSLERYFEVVPLEGQGLELCLVPNGLAVLRLAAGHPAAATATALDFDPELQTSYTGKRKKGAMQLNVGTPLCTIRGAAEPCLVACPIRARLLEFNEGLAANPALLRGKQGFLAILKPDMNPAAIRALGARQPPAAAAAQQGEASGSSPDGAPATRDAAAQPAEAGASPVAR